MNRLNPLQIRMDIMKYLYRLSGQTAGKELTIYSGQIEGYYYTEIKDELKILSEKGLLRFSGNFISRKLKISLTQTGLAFMEEAYQAVKRNDPAEKELALQKIFEYLRV